MTRQDYIKQWRQQHAAPGITKLKRNNLMAKFGMSVEEYLTKVEEQNNKCAICNKEETTLYKGERRLLTVDHCHKTGKIRRLLCLTCNNGLGCFKDDKELLEKAIDYLKEFEEERIDE